MDNLIYETKTKFNFHIIVPYSENQFKGLLKNTKHMITIYENSILGCINLSEKEKELLGFSEEEGDMCPIYFSHRVFNEYSSFPQVYLHGYVRENVSF